MQNNPLVSVLIPLYNAEKYFEECIASIISQNYKNLEVIIVNDGSTDNSLSLAKKYADKYKWIKVYSQENSGASIARNKAFSHSTGEYIQYLDADDILHPDKIEAQMQRLSEYDFDPKVIATSKWSRFFFNLKNLSFPQLTFYKDYSDSLMFLRDAWENNQNMIIHTWLISRKLHQSIEKWNENMTTLDDNLFFAHAVLRSTQIAFVPNGMVYWRQDNLNSLSKSTTWEDMYSYLRGCHNYFDLVKDNLDYPGIKYALAMEYSKCIYRSYPMFPDIVKEAESSLRWLGYDQPLPRPTKKFRWTAKLIGFYPAARLFGLKDKLIKKIRAIKDSKNGH